MIDLEKDTPVEYSKQSRDYQVFRYVYNALFNKVKMYVDLIKNIWTDDIDDKLLLLRSYTLNFIPYYQWANDDLRGATNNFRYLVRNKGTKDAIKACLEILARVRGLSLIGTDVVVEDNGLIKLIVNEEIADVGNIEDLLRYILPIGSYYEIIKYSRQAGTAETNIVVGDKFDYANSTEEDSRYKSYQLGLPEADGIGYDLYDSNSSISYHTGMIITKGQSHDTINIIINGKQVTSPYTGNEQVFSFSGSSTEDNCCFSFSANSPKVGKVILYQGGVEIDTLDIKGTNTGNYYCLFDTASNYSFKAFESDGTEITDVKFEINTPLTITITPIQINITGKTIGANTLIYYNRNEQTVPVEYDATSDMQGFNPNLVAIDTNHSTISGTDAGTYKANLSPNYFTYDGMPGGGNITFNIVEDSVFIISKNPNWHLTITGNEEEKFYIEDYYSVEGFNWTTDGVFEIELSDFTVNNAATSGMDAGDYYMGYTGNNGLAYSDFVLNNNNLYFETTNPSTWLDISGGKLTVKKVPVEEIRVECPVKTHTYNGMSISWDTNEFPSGYNVKVVTSAEYFAETGKVWDDSILDGPGKITVSAGPLAGTYVYSGTVTLALKPEYSQNFDYNSDFVVTRPITTIIDPRNITITANDLFIEEGTIAEDLAYTSTITSMPSSTYRPVQPEFSYYSEYAETTPAGTVMPIMIIPTPGSTNNLNYNITTVNGTLTVT